MFGKMFCYCFHLNRFYIFALDLGHVRVVRQQRESGQSLHERVSLESNSEIEYKFFCFKNYKITY